MKAAQCAAANENTHKKIVYMMRILSRVSLCGVALMYVCMFACMYLFAVLMHSCVYVLCMHVRGCVCIRVQSVNAEG